jgi:hypothetical protein
MSNNNIKIKFVGLIIDINDKNDLQNLLNSIWNTSFIEELAKKFTNFLSVAEICDDPNVIIFGCQSSHYINDYCNSNAFKILVVTEPINNYEVINDKYNDGFFDLITGSIDNNPERNRFKLPYYMIGINKTSIFGHCDINIHPEKNFILINKYVKECNLEGKKFCSLINSHDNWGTRTNIYNKLSMIDTIECPGKLFNNISPDNLNSRGNVEYLRDFLFNICIENNISTHPCTNTPPGYITEKLALACLGGAIPVYYGWFDDIDEKIFNRNRIIFCDPYDKKSIDDGYLKVVELLSDKNKLEDFYRQDIFLESAYGTLCDMLTSIFNKLLQINV